MLVDIDLHALEGQLGLVESVEAGRHHRVEDRVDDVLLAAPRRRVGIQHVRQRHCLLVDGEDVVAGDQDVDLERPQGLVDALRLVRLIEEAGEGEDHVLAVGVELARRRAVRLEPQQPIERVIGDPERLSQGFAARLAHRDIDPEEASGLAERVDPLLLLGADSFDHLAHRPAEATTGPRRTLRFRGFGGR